jgi:transposase
MHDLARTDFAAFVGIDWADQKHDICLVDAATGRKDFSVLDHTPEAIAEWASSLRVRFDARPVAVCLEASRGPLLYALIRYDFLVLYPINPATLASYRQAFSPSRAKDDPSDADYQAEIVRHHRDRLRPWLPDDETTRTLQLLVEHRRRLVGDRTRISNRLTALLKAYFPQALDWFDDIRSHLAADFLLTWPSLDALSRVRTSTFETFFRRHHCYNRDAVARRIASIRSAVALTSDSAIITASRVMAKALAAQMKTTIDAITELDRQIERLCAAHPDFPLFDALPGAGPVLASRLTAAFGSRRDRYASADELARLSGIAPVLERSGTRSRVRWRSFCPKFLRQTFHEYAGASIKDSVWARAYYDQQRARGLKHQAAVRALAFKWIRILWKCWQTRTPYDERTYLARLRNNASPLLAFAAVQQN